MRATIALRDVVRVTEHVFLVAVVPLHGDLDRRSVAVRLEVKHGRMYRRLVTVQMLDESPDATLVLKLVVPVITFVVEPDPDTGVQERQFPQPTGKDVVMELDIGEGLGTRLEPHGRPRAVRVADDRQRGDRLPVPVFLLVDLAVPVNGQDQLLR